MECKYPYLQARGFLRAQASSPLKGYGRFQSLTRLRKQGCLRSRECKYPYLQARGFLRAQALSSLKIIIVFNRSHDSANRDVYVPVSASIPTCKLAVFCELKRCRL